MPMSVHYKQIMVAQRHPVIRKCFIKILSVMSTNIFKVSLLSELIEFGNVSMNDFGVYGDLAYAKTFP